MKHLLCISGAILMAYLMMSCTDRVTSSDEQLSQEIRSRHSSGIHPSQSGNIKADNRNFRAHLSGSEEVPPADTRGQGQAIFQLSKDGTELTYKLIAANIENITQAHIHCGAAGVNGPVVVFLYPAAPPAELIPERFNGVLAEGVRTNDNVISRPDSDECPGGVVNFNELMAKIRSGDAYVNVHTLQYPGGEIRGQIF